MKILVKTERVKIKAEKMSDSQDNQPKLEEMVHLYHKGTKITYDNLGSLSLKKLKSVAKSMGLFVNLSCPRLSDWRAKQRIISVLKVHIKNNLNPFQQYDDNANGDDQKTKIQKSEATLLEFPCQKPSVKNFSMEFEITFTKK